MVELKSTTQEPVSSPTAPASISTPVSPPAIVFLTRWFIQDTTSRAGGSCRAAVSPPDGESPALTLTTLLLAALVNVIGVRGPGDELGTECLEADALITLALRTGAAFW